MTKQIFHQSTEELKRVVEHMRAKPLVPHCHLFKRHPGKTIGEAAGLETKKGYSHEARKKPGLMLLSVILSIHNDYTRKVEPVIDRLRKTSFCSFKDLEALLSDERRFAETCGGYEEKRRILRELMPIIHSMKQKCGIQGDYEVMEEWAKRVSIRDIKSDPIGCVRGIGPAAFQHLRMNFGVDTTKPDQRVKEVLEREFGFRLFDAAAAVVALEELAERTGYTVIELDQICVNYGSGYYY